MTSSRFHSSKGFPPQSILSPEKTNKFKASLEKFLRERSPLEDATLCFWAVNVWRRWKKSSNELGNEKFRETVDSEKKEVERKIFGRDVFEIRKNDLRNAHKLCGKKSGSFVLHLKKTVEDFFKEFKLLEGCDLTVIGAYASLLYDR